MLQLSLKTIQKIKIIFKVFFITIVVFQLFKSAFLSLPKDWLFFLTSDAVEHLVCVLIVCFLYYYILKLKNIWRKSGLLIVLIIPLILLALLKDYRIHNVITFEQTFEYFTSFLGQTLLFYALLYFINRLEFFNKYKTLEQELNKTKAQLLQNQLHPHFLFNAINSLYSLSLKNHPETSDSILKLSSMMRYLTDESQRNTVPLNIDLDFITNYSAIEDIRFGKDSRIT